MFKDFEDVGKDRKDFICNTRNNLYEQRSEPKAVVCRMSTRFGNDEATNITQLQGIDGRLGWVMISVGLVFLKRETRHRCKFSSNPMRSSRWNSHGSVILLAMVEFI